MKSEAIASLFFYAAQHTLERTLSTPKSLADSEGELSMVRASFGKKAQLEKVKSEEQLSRTAKAICRGL